MHLFVGFPVFCTILTVDRRGIREVISVTSMRSRARGRRPDIAHSGSFIERRSGFPHILLHRSKHGFLAGEDSLLSRLFPVA